MCDPTSPHGRFGVFQPAGLFPRICRGYILGAIIIFPRRLFEYAPARRHGSRRAAHELWRAPRAPFSDGRRRWIASSPPPAPAFLFSSLQLRCGGVLSPPRRPADGFAAAGEGARTPSQRSGRRPTLLDGGFFFGEAKIPSHHSAEGRASSAHYKLCVHITCVCRPREDDARCDSPRLEFDQVVLRSAIASRSRRPRRPRGPRAEERFCGPTTIPYFRLWASRLCVLFVWCPCRRGHSTPGARTPSQRSGRRPTLLDGGFFLQRLRYLAPLRLRDARAQHTSRTELAVISDSLRRRTCPAASRSRARSARTSSAASVVSSPAARAASALRSRDSSSASTAPRSP